jgi:nicotinate phosphoribosyltransferase
VATDPVPVLRKNMNVIAELYNTPLTMLTDFYQITSAYALWKAGKHQKRTAYHMFFRGLPFKGGYAVASGLQYALDWIRGAYFQDKDLTYLSEQKGNDGKRLFDDGFLKWLDSFRFRCDVDAVPEGTVVFPFEPLVRVEGTIIENLLIETFLLNAINYPTLVATKAARVCDAAGGAPVLEMGLRRAQGIDGAIAGSRAAMIGGATGTSNVFAGQLFAIPIKGTHPHGFVMAFDTEAEAFQAFADAMPNNCVFLVDTYNTLQGVKHAIEVSLSLKQKGYEPIGIRLDSGDLAFLSKEARAMMDAADLKGMKVFATNDLDEWTIRSLREQGACIDVWGVGTKLITAYDQPALGGVYKLGAVEDAGTWSPKIKVSEQAIKTTIPGVLQVARFTGKDGFFLGDMIFDPTLGGTASTMIDPGDFTRRKSFDGAIRSDLLQPVLREGQIVGTQPSLKDIQAYRQEQLSHVHPGILRFDNPHSYPVGLEPRLHDRRTKMILDAKGIA